MRTIPIANHTAIIVTPNPTNNSPAKQTNLTRWKLMDAKLCESCVLFVRVGSRNRMKWNACREWLLCDAQNSFVVRHICLVLQSQFAYMLMQNADIIAAVVPERHETSNNNLWKQIYRVAPENRDLSIKTRFIKYAWHGTRCNHQRNDCICVRRNLNNFLSAVRPLSGTKICTCSVKQHQSQSA